MIKFKKRKKIFQSLWFQQPKDFQHNKQINIWFTPTTLAFQPLDTKLALQNMGDMEVQHLEQVEEYISKEFENLKFSEAEWQRRNENVHLHSR